MTSTNNGNTQKSRAELKREARAALDMVRTHVYARNFDLADEWRARLSEIEAELRTRKS